MARALDGIQVVDFSHVLAGPICTHYLCLQGADVVKVEPAAGDTMRSYGGQTHPDGLSPSFIAVNAGKRSVVLDLKDERQLGAARRLVAGADVVVENFRPGVMDRLGRGYEACTALNPGLVFCSISGFGQTGPLRANPAIDQIIQSMSGLMMLSGEPGSPALRVGFPLVDTYTGLTAAFAIMGSLLRRARTGAGQRIDVAMLDAALAMMIPVAGPLLAAGVEPRRTGNLGYSQSPTADTFPTADGEITLGVVRQEQFEALCGVLQRTEWLRDPRFATRRARQDNAPSLRTEVVAALRGRDAIAWERLLNEAGVAAGAVRTLPQALQMEQLSHRALRLPVELPSGRGQVLNAGFLLAEDPAGIEQPPPTLGQHTRQVLQGLGYAAAEIDAMTAAAPAPPP